MERGPFAEALALSCRLRAGLEPELARPTGEGEFLVDTLELEAEALGELEALRDGGTREEDADIDRQVSP
jgi:hypothetical protein